MLDTRTSLQANSFMLPELSRIRKIFGSTVAEMNRGSAEESARACVSVNALAGRGVHPGRRTRRVPRNVLHLTIFVSARQSG